MVASSCASASASFGPAGWVGRCSVAGRARPAARVPSGPRTPASTARPKRGLPGARIFELRRTGCTVASPLVHHSGSSEGKKIALTFDDGPSAYTEQVIRILDRGGAEGHVLRARDRGSPEGGR